MLPEFIRSAFPKYGFQKDYLKSIRSQRIDDFFMIEITMPKEKVKDLQVNLQKSYIRFQLGASEQILFLHKNADTCSLHSNYYGNKYQIVLKRKQIDPVENINRLALDYV